MRGLVAREASGLCVLRGFRGSDFGFVGGWRGGGGGYIVFFHGHGELQRSREFHDAYRVRA